MERINELADHPEFYHLLKNSCTINIVRYANRAGREGPLDIRQIINGWVDRYLYRAGHVDTSLPFDELRKRLRCHASFENGQHHGRVFEADSCQLAAVSGNR